jgi:hypothetical protein
MDRERDALEAAHRAHLRQMTDARRAAEHKRAMLRPRDAEERRAADAALRAEIARLSAEHQAWLREHLPASELPGGRHEPRSRRVMPPT